MVECLLEGGAEVNKPGSYDQGRTALQAAAESRHKHSGAAPERGAGVNAPESAGKGRTALQAAAESGHMNFVGRLLKKGVEVNAPASAEQGKTALQPEVDDWAFVWNGC